MPNELSMPNTWKNAVNHETESKTMCRRNRILFALAIIPAVVTALIFVRGGSGTPRVALEAIRIAPNGDVRQDIVSSSFAPVDFQYRIVNRGRSPLTGLKLGTSCACEITAAPPGEIAPGGSAVIGFRLRAPYAGRLQRQIPITVAGTQEPLLVLTATLRVKFDPPAILPSNQDHNLLFVRGDASPRELVFETIERKRSEPWMTGLELNPSDAIEVHPHRMEELLEQDPELTRRRYHFPLTNRMLDIGQHSVVVTLHTRKDDPSAASALSLRVAVIDSVAIVPNPLVIKYTPGAQLGREECMSSIARVPPRPRLRSSTMKMSCESVVSITRGVPARHLKLSRWESLKAFLTLR